MAPPKDTQVRSLLEARVRMTLSSLPLPRPVLCTFPYPTSARMLFARRIPSPNVCCPWPIQVIPLLSTLFTLEWCVVG